MARRIKQTEIIAMLQNIKRHDDGRLTPCQFEGLVLQLEWCGGIENEKVYRCDRCRRLAECIALFDDICD